MFKRIIKLFGISILCLQILTISFPVGATENTEDSFTISEEEIQKIENAYNSYDWENEYGDSRTDIKINSEKILKAYPRRAMQFADGKTFEEVYAIPTLRSCYVYELEQSSGEIEYVMFDFKGKFSYEPLQEKKEWFETLYEKAVNGKEFLLSSKSLNLNPDLEILSTYCFYEFEKPFGGSIGIGFVTNQGRFYYHRSSAEYEFLMPIDVLYESTVFELELYKDTLIFGTIDIGTNYDLSEYALGDYSPPQSTRPPMPSYKDTEEEQGPVNIDMYRFDPIHLWWIIPSAVAVIGGGVFLGVYFIKRKKKKSPS